MINNDNNILERINFLLTRIQGIGPRSASRILLDIMKKRDTILPPLISSLQALATSITTCNECFNIDTQSPCHICSDQNRDGETLCVVEDIAALWAIERAGIYFGKYFVLGGNLMSQRSTSPEDLQIDKLLSNVEQNNIKELILATSTTLEGQMTANYITDQFYEGSTVKISQLAQGIPVGGELDYLDTQTLTTAFNLRKNYAS